MTTTTELVWPFRTAPWVVRVALAMKDRGLSDSEVARALNVHGKSVGRWQRMAGDLPPSWPGLEFDQWWLDTAADRARNAAKLRSWRIRTIVDGPILVDATGTRRRLQALMAIGWTSTALAVRGGWCSPDSLLQYCQRTKVTARTRERVRDLYEDLCMTPGTSSTVRRLAARQGWAPPLAWEEDIDDPAAAPDLGTDPDPALVDQTVVDRILAGDVVPANPAERAAVVTAWDAAGRSHRSLAQLTGWNVHRYLDRAAS